MTSALGVASVERNGHHYFRGLSFLPSSLQESIRVAHPDLFERHANSLTAIKINEGQIAVGNVNAAPFGFGLLPEVEKYSSDTGGFSMEMIAGRQTGTA